MAPELTEVKHKCDICLQILKSADGLRHHQKNVHGEKKCVSPSTEQIGWYLSLLHPLFVLQFKLLKITASDSPV